MTLYTQHLEQLRTTFDEGLKRANVDGVLIYAGEQKYPFQDDNGQRVNINPYFKYWLPLTSQVKSFVYYEANQKPRLFLYQISDYWHAQPETPPGEWQEHFDLTIISDPLEVSKHLNQRLTNTAFIGEETELATELGINNVNPSALLNYINYQRAYKSAYEINNMRNANQLAAKAHLAAKTAFYNGASELEIHQAYLAAINIRESELPYNNIIALNQHGAILHYDHYQTTKPTQFKSFLIDAGASFNGYHADISRTYIGEQYANHEFSELYQAYQQEYAELLGEISLDKSYLAFHDSSHRRMAKLLSQFGLLNCSAEKAYEHGYSRVFFPCGTGHYIGLQVHDIGGYLSENGLNESVRDPRYPFLRLNRPMENNVVFTVEPGIYFIDMLLEQHKDNPDFNWSRINHFKSFGGFRMEDSIAMVNGKPENLSQQAFDEFA